LANKRKHSIDELFSTRLKHRQEKAPADAWERLSRSLYQKEKVVRMHRIRAAAAVAAVFITFFAGLWFSDLALLPDKKQPTLQKESKSNGHSLPFLSSFLQEKVFVAHQYPQKINASLTKRTPGALHFHSEDDSLPETQNPDSRLISYSTEFLPATNNKFSMDIPESILSRMLMQPFQASKPVEKKKTPSQRWHVSGIIGPSYTYRTTNNDNLALFNNSYHSKEDNYDVSEKGTLNYSGGISAQYALNNRWEIESGFVYSQIGQQKNTLLVNQNPGKEDGYELTTSAGKLDASNLPKEVTNDMFNSGDYGPLDINEKKPSYDATLFQQFDYLEIPVIFRYKMYEKTIRFNLITGMSTGILVGNQSYVNLQGQKQTLGATKNLRDLLYSSILGVGLQYQITRTFSFRLEPTFKYALHSINKSEEFIYRPYSFELRTGIRVQF
jgi:hypothetical protein